jgi:hypothetical protein
MIQERSDPDEEAARGPADDEDNRGGRT